MSFSIDVVADPEPSSWLLAWSRTEPAFWLVLRTFGREAEGGQVFGWKQVVYKWSKTKEQHLTGSLADFLREAGDVCGEKQVVGRAGYG